MRDLIRIAVGAAIGGAALVFGTVAVVPLAVQMESRLWPPMRNWTPTEWHVDGRDVVITGHMVKPRDCTYRPPSRARDERGQNYFVESLSATRALSWDASDRPQRFGPWRVPNSAGHRLAFYQEYRCHPLWNLTVELGTLDLTKE